MKFEKSFSIENWAAENNVKLAAKVATTERNQPGTPSEGTFFVPDFSSNGDGSEIDFLDAMDNLRSFLDHATEEGADAIILQKVCQQLNTDLLNKKRGELAKPPSKKDIAEKAAAQAQAELQAANEKAGRLAGMALAIAEANEAGDAETAVRITTEMVSLASS